MAYELEPKLSTVRFCDKKVRLEQQTFFRRGVGTSGHETRFGCDVMEPQACRQEGGEEVEVVHTTGYWPHPYTPGFAGHSTRLCLVLYTLLDHSIP